MLNLLNNVDTSVFFYYTNSDCDEPSQLMKNTFSS